MDADIQELQNKFEVNTYNIRTMYNQSQVA